MGAPWADYFRMRIPESKCHLDPGSKLIHAKYECKKNCSVDLKKKGNNGRSKKKKHGRPMGSAPMKKKSKTWAF